MTRQLVLIRHAKAVDPAEASSDHDRSLTHKGTEDAAALGRWLKDEGVRPDLVLCSTAARTRETWAAISEAAGFGVLVDHERRIYNATAATLLQVIREGADDARTVVLIGHAPGVPTLAAALAEGRSDVDFGEVFRPAGCAILAYDGAWADLAPGTASVVATHS